MRSHSRRGSKHFVCIISLNVSPPSHEAGIIITFADKETELHRTQNNLLKVKKPKKWQSVYLIYNRKLKELVKIQCQKRQTTPALRGLIVNLRSLTPGSELFFHPGPTHWRESPSNFNPISKGCISSTGQAASLFRIPINTQFSNRIPGGDSLVLILIWSQYFSYKVLKS